MNNPYTDFFMFLILTNLGLCIIALFMIYLRSHFGKKHRKCLENLVMALEILDGLNPEVQGRDETVKSLIAETIEILAGFEERKK